MAGVGMGPPTRQGRAAWTGHRVNRAGVAARHEAGRRRAAGWCFGVYPDQGPAPLGLAGGAMGARRRSPHGRGGPRETHLSPRPINAQASLRPGCDNRGTSPPTGVGTTGTEKRQRKWPGRLPKSTYIIDMGAFGLCDKFWIIAAVFSTVIP
jgi:hypothetical protein